MKILAFSANLDGFEKEKEIFSALRGVDFVISESVEESDVIDAARDADIILFASTTLFSFITLPVEIDASRRALAWLQMSGITNSGNHQYASSALRSAAYTYVVAALSSLATLLYYVMIYLNRRD